MKIRDRMILVVLAVVAARTTATGGLHKMEFGQKTAGAGKTSYRAAGAGGVPENGLLTL